jgi:serine/threonine protein kinase
MAPEYIHQGTVSKKADMFSLGVVMLELLTGSKGPEYSEEKEKQKKKEIFLEKVSLERFECLSCNVRNVIQLIDCSRHLLSPYNIVGCFGHHNFSFFHIYNLWVETELHG